MPHPLAIRIEQLEQRLQALEQAVGTTRGRSTPAGAQPPVPVDGTWEGRAQPALPPEPTGPMPEIETSPVVKKAPTRSSPPPAREATPKPPAKRVPEAPASPSSTPSPTPAPRPAPTPKPAPPPPGASTQRVTSTHPDSSAPTDAAASQELDARAKAFAERLAARREAEQRAAARTTAQPDGASMPTPATKPVAPARAPIDWERFVATRIVPIGGAVALMIAAALLVRLMINAGLITDAGKCILGALLGFSLIGAGELVRRRVNAIASAGLSGAGIGALYIAVFGASAWYGLLSPAASFVLLVATAALGIAIAGWGRLRSIGVLSLLGGYAAPFLLAVPEPNPLVLPTYSLVLLSAGLWLSAWRPATFLPLRPIVWWGTVIVGTIWMFLQGGLDHLGALATFLGAFWLIVHTAIALAAKRADARATPGDPSREPTVTWAQANAVITSFGTTIWTVTLAVIASHHVGATIQPWAVTGVFMVACLSGFFVLADAIRGLRDTPRTDGERLSVGLLAQSGALLVATVAYAFSGSAQIAAWLAMGVAFVLAGRWINARSLDVYGVMLLAIGTLRVLLFDSMRILPTTSGVDLMGLRLTDWTWMMLGAGFAWMLAARLELVRRFQTFPPIVFSSISMVLFGMAMIHPAVSVEAIGSWWLLIAIVGAVVSRFERRFHSDIVALAPLTLAIATWVGSYPVRWGAFTEPALLHPGFISGLIMAGALILWRRLTAGGSFLAGQRFHEELRWLTRALVPVGLVLLFIATTLEAARIGPMLGGATTAARAAVSIWWGLFASGLIVGGFWRHAPMARRIGLALLLIAALKTGILDLRGVPELWRLVSFLGLGLLMSAVAVGYFHVQQRLEKRPAP